MQTKATYRQIVRDRRSAVSSQELIRQSEAILAQVEALPEFRESSVVAAYWSLPDEVPTHDFVRRWCREKTVLLPVMRPDGGLELRPWLPDGAMRTAAFGIPEPEGEAFPLERVGLILVPGVAFDRQGNRLGRGKGYYDRLLTTLPAFKVGICFDFQHFDQLPANPHDVPMDRVVSG